MRVGAEYCVTSCHLGVSSASIARSGASLINRIRNWACSAAAPNRSHSALAIRYSAPSGSSWRRNQRLTIPRLSSVMAPALGAVGRQTLLAQPLSTSEPLGAICTTPLEQKGGRRTQQCSRDGDQACEKSLHAEDLTISSQHPIAISRSRAGDGDHPRTVGPSAQRTVRTTHSHVAAKRDQDVYTSSRNPTGVDISAAMPSSSTSLTAGARRRRPVTGTPVQRLWTQFPAPYTCQQIAAGTTTAHLPQPLSAQACQSSWRSACTRELVLAGRVQNRSLWTVVLLLAWSRMAGGSKRAYL